MQKLVSPLYIVRNRKGTKAYLNLNNYRNWSFIVSNGLKKKYKEVMMNQVKALNPIQTPCYITYVLYPKSKRLCDVANICCVIDKFLCDAITEAGKWEDDNYLYLPKVIYKFGSVDKVNPRCDVYINSYTLKDIQEMKVTISKEELQAAVIDFFGLPLDTEVSLEQDIEPIQLEKLEAIKEVVTEALVEVQETKPRTKRTRRTRKQIEQDEANEVESIGQINVTHVSGESDILTDIPSVEVDEIQQELNLEEASINETNSDESADSNDMETIVEVSEDDSISSDVPEVFEEVDDSMFVIDTTEEDEPVFADVSDTAMFAEVLEETADEEESLFVDEPKKVTPLF